MALPLNENETKRLNYFNATHYISVYIGCTVFNAVMRVNKKDKKKIESFYKDLPACETDCLNMKDTLKRFQFTDPNHTYDLKDPT